MKNLFQFHREASEPVPLVTSSPEKADNAPTINVDEIVAEEVRLKPDSRVIYHLSPHSAAADRYRLLRMRLRELLSASKSKCLLVTSPLPEDGKSTTVLNLATALSDHGRSKVLVMEADLYHSPLLGRLGLEGAPGLAECLESEVSLQSAIRRLEPLHWYLLPAGKAIANPSELLQTEAFSYLMQRLTSSFDWILVDSPPIGPLVDALLLRRHCDGTLLVARAGRTPRRDIEKSLELLGKQNVLAVVLNAIEADGQRYSNYSSYYPPSSS